MLKPGVQPRDKGQNYNEPCKGVTSLAAIGLLPKRGEGWGEEPQENREIFLQSIVFFQVSGVAWFPMNSHLTW